MKYLHERIRTVAAKKMDCAWDDGIPGSDRKADEGLSWFSILFRITESRELATAPNEIQIISASCFQRAAKVKQPATSHLLWRTVL